ncbi:ATP-binding response regulator [Thalassotalea agariperforans]
MELTKKTKILVVDDFDSMRKVTCSQLRTFGVEKVTQASDGTEALNLLLEHSFDLILCDWNMPAMTGLELLMAVRANKALCHIPFIMLTGEAGRERVIEAIAHGVSSLIVKPYSANVLLERINKATKWHAPSKTVTHTTQPASEIEKPASADIKQSRPTILIVDDNSDNVEVLYQLLKDEYRIQVALNGKRALEICCSDTPPDLVLLDIMMPEMDGFAVAKKMRSHPNAESIPIIFVTAMEGDKAQSKGLALGAVDYVTKPIDPNLLLPRIRNFMRYVLLHKTLQYEYDTLQENARLREQVELITQHDIKGSVAAVIGIIQSLNEGHSLKDLQRQQLRLAEQSALQAINIINLSAELYKIETGQYTLTAKSLPIADVLRQIVTIARNNSANKTLQIIVDTDVTEDEHLPQVLGDITFCYSLFQNLLANACEAAPAKTKVEVKLYDENPVKVCITNHGVVPIEIRKHFFDKLVTHGKSGGTGLGTYSAKLLTEAQNGHISFESSDENNQTVLTVILPRDEASSSKN